MKSIQEIFDVVIGAEIYDPWGEEQAFSSSFMCFALGVACNHFGVITEEERVYAHREIKCYVRTLCSLADCHTDVLSTALSFNELPNKPDDLNKVYTNWGNRPLKPTE